MSNFSISDLSSVSGVDVDILKLLSEKMYFDFILYLEKDYLVLGDDGIVSGGTFHSVSTRSNRSELGIGSCVPDMGIPFVVFF